MAATINGAPCRALVNVEYEEETDNDEDDTLVDPS
jgi:hypothetical protein